MENNEPLSQCVRNTQSCVRKNLSQPQVLKLEGTGRAVMTGSRLETSQIKYLRSLYRTFVHLALPKWTTKVGAAYLLLVVNTVKQMDIVFCMLYCMIWTTSPPHLFFTHHQATGTSWVWFFFVHNSLSCFCLSCTASAWGCWHSNCSFRFHTLGFIC